MYKDSPSLNLKDDNMFVRTVRLKGHRYVRIVENYRERGTLHQRVIANLGNLRLPKVLVEEKLQP